MPGGEKGGAGVIHLGLQAPVREGGECLPATCFRAAQYSSSWECSNLRSINYLHYSKGSSINIFHFRVHPRCQETKDVSLSVLAKT